MNIYDVKKLGNLVDEKGWQAFDQLMVGDETVIGALTKFLSKMNIEQRNLSFDILQEYLVIKEYQIPTKELLGMIVDSTTEKNIYISTVKDFKAKKVKSGGNLTYDIDSLSPQFPHKIIKTFEDPSNQDFINASGYKVLIDDFIGSANQFFDMKDALNEDGIELKCDCVAALVFQNSGKLRIEAAGYETVFLYDRPKSLENIAQTHGLDLLETYKIYDSIETIANCPAEFNRGYEASEASVTLKKTPNNTLPIFWSYGGKTKWPAPFPRPKN